MPGRPVSATAASITLIGRSYGDARSRTKSRWPLICDGLNVTVTVSRSDTGAPGAWHGPVEKVLSGELMGIPPLDAAEDTL